MKKLLVAVTVGALVLASNVCWAGIPFLMNYQGMLTDTLGNPLTGDYNLTFKIYSQPSGGSDLWTETHTGTQVEDGLYNVILGSLSLLPSSVFEDTVRYLGITVGTDTELSPRIRITSIPYAYRALVADSAAVAGSVAGSGGGWVDDGSVVRLETSTDKVGIGTSSPQAGLHLKGTEYPTSFMFLQSDAGQDAGIRFYEGEDVKWHIFNSSSDGGLRIYNANGTRTVFFADQSTGNVGIGTTTPNDHLHVANHIRIGEDQTYPTVYGELKHDGGGTGFKINAHAGGGGWADLHFQTNAVTRMFIESAGNVGIGTTSPSEKLDVEGNIDVSDNEVKNYYGFPQPDYNTGWVSISQGETKTFTHNLGGSYSNYFVDLTFYDNTGGVTGPHQEGFGGWYDGTNYRGTYWYDLDTSLIRVHRWSGDTSTDWVRVRIWVIR